MRDGGWRKGGGQGSGAGGRQPPPAPRKSPEELLREKIAGIQRSAGLSPAMAREVALGRADLNDVLKRMAQADEVVRLMQNHAFDKALASQVAMGLVDLQAVLERRRIAAHVAEHRGRDVFQTALGGGEQVIGIHGRELVRGTVGENRPYEVVVADAERGADRLLHKTAIKFVATSAVWAKARKSMTWDNERKRLEVSPILRPQDRYGCSNGRLGEAWARARPVRILLVEGEIFVGQVAWVARWDFGLETRGGPVAILRHALADFANQD
jgi:hypothetical protein